MLPQAWQIKEIGPGDSYLLQVGVFPVVQTVPGWEDKHPGLLLIQLQHQVRHPHVHVTTKVEPLMYDTEVRLKSKNSVIYCFDLLSRVYKDVINTNVPTDFQFTW